MSECCRNPHAVHWTPGQQADLVHGAVVVFTWAGEHYTADVMGTLVEGDRHCLRSKSLKGNLWLWFEDCGAAHLAFNAATWGFGGAVRELHLKAITRQGVLL